MYSLEFQDDWRDYFRNTPPDIQKRFKKRIDKYETFPNFGFRHEELGVDFFVDEIGRQYRVLFTSEENTKVRRFYFIGDHKEYEKFLGTRK